MSEIIPEVETFADALLRVKRGLSHMSEFDWQKICADASGALEDEYNYLCELASTHELDESSAELFNAYGKAYSSLCTMLKAETLKHLQGVV